MLSLRKALKSFLHEEACVTAMEFALLGSLIAVVIIGAVTGVGQNVQALFSNVADQVIAAVSNAL